LSKTKKKKRNIKKTNGFKDSIKNGKKKSSTLKSISKKMPIKRNTMKLKINGAKLKGMTKSKSTSQIGSKGKKV